MQIPMGNFGQALPDQVQPRQVIDTGIAQQSQVIQGAVMGVVQQKLDEQKAAKAAADKLDNAARLSQAEVDSNAYGFDQHEQVKQGKINALKATENIDKYAADYTKQNTVGLEPERAAALGQAYSSTLNRQKLALPQAQDEYYQKTANGGTDTVLSNQAQLFAQDPEGAKTKVLATLDANPYLLPDQKVKKYQEWYAKNSSDLVDGMTNKLSEGSDIEGLKNLRDKIRDPKQYDGLTNREDHARYIDGQIRRIKGDVAESVKKRETVAEKTLKEYISFTGKPVAPTTIEEMRAKVAGTPSEAGFKAYEKLNGLIGDFQHISLPEQKQFLDSYDAKAKKLQTADPTAVEKIRGVYRDLFEKQQKLAADNPIQYIAEKKGKPYDAINVLGITTPIGQEHVVQQLQDRMIDIKTRQKTDGSYVGSNPFLPQELTDIQKMVSEGNKDTNIAAISTMVKTFGSTPDLDRTLKLMGGEDPSFRVAGLAQAAGIKTKAGVPLANIILDGAQIRKSKLAVLPPDELITTEFNAATAGAIQNPQTRIDMLDMTKNIYAALSDKYSNLSTKNSDHQDQAKSINDDLMWKAVKMATGGIYDFHGTKVIKPYGMDDTAFSEGLDASMQQVSKASGVPVDHLQNMPLIKTRSNGRDAYFISDGRGGYQKDPKTKANLMVYPK